MNGAISNPRRGLRLRLSCLVALEGARHTWTLQTDDVGHHGCCVATPAALAPGEPLGVTVLCPKTGAPLAVRATVAWCTPREPWRIGLSYAADDHGAAARWFDDVAGLHLGELQEKHDPVPDRLPLSARLRIGAFEAADGLRDEEAALLELALRRATLREVVGEMAPSWTAGQRALMTMLGRGRVALDLEPGEPGEPASPAPAAPRRLG